jgi:hypothetical protein
MDVWEYFVQKEREFADLSLTADRQSSDLFAEEAGSNGQRGRIFGTLNLDSPVPAFLAVSELVVVEGNHVRREEYGYFLVIKGVEIWGYERDLSHDPPVHRHTRSSGAVGSRSSFVQGGCRDGVEGSLKRRADRRHVRASVRLAPAPFSVLQVPGLSRAQPREPGRRDGFSQSP